MPKRRMTIDDLWKLRVIGGVSVSPDGEQIVFAMKRTDFRANKTYSSVYVVGVKGGRIRWLTHGNHMDVTPKWSADGMYVGFISDRDKARCLWLLPMDGGDPVRLTDRDGDVSGFAFSPGGKHLAYIYRPKNERQKLERDEKRDEIARRQEQEDEGATQQHRRDLKHTWARGRQSFHPDPILSDSPLLLRLA